MKIQSSICSQIFSCSILAYPVDELLLKVRETEDPETDISSNVVMMDHSESAAAQAAASAQGKEGFSGRPSPGEHRLFQTPEAGRLCPAPRFAAGPTAFAGH